MLAVRHQYAQFATGLLEVLPADNPSVLAYVRQARTVAGDLAGDWAGGEAVGETDGGSPAGMAAATSVLCVSNLSRFAQPAELSLGRWEGCTPIELLGRVPFPRVTSAPYSVTLAPYGIYWLELVER